MAKLKSHRTATLPAAATPPLKRKRAKRELSDSSIPSYLSAGRDCARHGLAKPHAFRDASILRVIEARVGDLKALNRRLDRWDLRQESRRTHRLRVLKSPDM